MEVPRTTLCYISLDDKWLFIHKRRKNDPNKGKYLGIGGHIEPGESVIDCMVREIYEETGIVASRDLSNLIQYGYVMFHSDKYGDEEMNVFGADFIGDLENIRKEFNEDDEGEVLWIPKTDAYNLPIWEGDKLIFDHLITKKAFNMGLWYEGEKLVKCESKNLY